LYIVQYSILKYLNFFCTLYKDNYIEITGVGDDPKVVLLEALPPGESVRHIIPQHEIRQG
jgi:hypothetical protein